MARYSVGKPRTFGKGYGILPFAKNMDRDSGKNITKNLNNKYSRKIFDHAKQSAIDALKSVSKRVIQ